MVKKISKKDIEEGQVLAGLMFLVSIFQLLGVIIAIIIWAIKRDNAYVNYHFKQLLIFWIVGLVGSVIGVILMFLIIGFILLPIFWIFMIVAWIMGMIHAFSGEVKPLPLFGKWGESFKF